MSTRPKALTVIAVIAIVLGSLTVIGGVSNAVAQKTTALQSRMNAARTDASHAPAAMVEAQAEFQRRMEDITGRRHGFFMMVLPFALLIGTALIVGGATALKMRPSSRLLLIAGMAAALILELAQAKPQLEVQLEIADATSTMMKSVLDGLDTKGGNSTIQSVASTTISMSKLATMTGVVMRGAIVAAEIGFFIFGLVYLSRARTRDLFAGRAASAAATPPGPGGP